MMLAMSVLSHSTGALECVRSKSVFVGWLYGDDRNLGACCTADRRRFLTTVRLIDRSVQETFFLFSFAGHKKRRAKYGENCAVTAHQSRASLCG